VLVLPVLVVLVVLAAGCGGGDKVAITTTAPPVRTASPADAADCLNSDQFLVEAHGQVIRGNAPDGVAFTARFYRTPAQALAALARLDPLYATSMGAAVIDYRGNPPAHRGGEPMKLIHDDFATLRHCILPR
jgi:hypothetical protein